MVEAQHPDLSQRRQCQLLGLNRAGLYYQAVEESPQNLQLMHLLDEQYTRHPFYGVVKMTQWLQAQHYQVNPKRVRRLLRKMGLMALYPKPNLSRAAVGHKVYPYLLRGVRIERVNQVWSTDITYVRLSKGFVYLVAIIDWFSRYVLSWELSVSLDTAFCMSALEKALQSQKPEIFNSDQGSQFTSVEFSGRLFKEGIEISMDGRGRALDNIFVERLWRSVKYEDIYLKDYQSVKEALKGLESYFEFYNSERLHQSLGYQTPEAVYPQGQKSAAVTTLN
jgi:putative transposase